jgi:hypothetical protein
MMAMMGLNGWRYSKALPSPTPKLEMGIGFLPLDRQHAAFIAKRAASQNEL